MPDRSLVIVSAINDQGILSRNLRRSPDVFCGEAQMMEERGHSSAALAYNAGLKHAGDAAFVAFIHQDVYLPADWIKRVNDALKRLEGDWAVAGVWGIRNNGQFAGRVWCSGGGQEHVGLPGTNEVASLDEIVLILNMRHGLRFDHDLPGFHLYGTDIIMQARQRGLKAFCIDAPVVHNSRCNHNVYDRAYRAAYRYMQRKWGALLPLNTCVAPITARGQWEIRRRWMKAEARRFLGRVKFWPRPENPQLIARQLGYECGTET